ncbi:MAG TPA: serine/threonine-protein kinase, partial [Byssovorax sp.]
MIGSDDEDTRDDETAVEPPRGERSRAAETAELSRGSVVGRYVVLDKLGSGGMGVVYAAYDPELDRRVAVKLMQANRDGSTPGTEGRLQREAQALARLAHPNVVGVFDVGAAGDRVWIAMELVDGVQLQQWLAARTRSWRDVVTLFLGAGRGLAAAHDAGVVHRDFKPHNVLVGRDGRARVLDFGLACATGDPAVSFSSGRTRHGALDEDLTVTGSVLGTPMYMPPEAERAEAVGPAGDQFSFCVTLYEALYGERPFKVRPPGELPLPPPPPPNTSVPGWLRRVVLRGLSLRPGDRHPSMSDLLVALEADPARARRRVLAGAALGLATAGLVAGAVVWRDHVRSAVPDDPCDASHPAWWTTKLDPAASDALARWDRAWLDERARACSATRDEHSQPETVLLVRLACLDRQLDDTQALVTLLENGDSTLARQGAGAIRQLPRAEVCANASAVSVPPAPPEELRPRVEALDARLLRANALD